MRSRAWVAASSNAAERDALDAMVGALAQDQAGALAGGQNVGGRVAESGLAQTHEAGDVPVLDHFGIGIHVDREVEEVGDEGDGLDRCLADGTSWLDVAALSQ